jgi:hypothetical protein
MIAGAGQGRPTTTPLPAAIDRLIATVRVEGRLDHAIVARTLGLRLRPVSETSAFRTFVAVAAGMDGLAIVTEWREPIPGRGATAGPLLSLSITGECRDLPALARHYGPLTVTDTPHHGLPGEQTYWSRTERWGRLSFGFAERARNCLSTIVLSDDRPLGSS